MQFIFVKRLSFHNFEMFFLDSFLKHLYIVFLSGPQAPKKPFIYIFRGIRRCVHCIVLRADLTLKTFGNYYSRHSKSFFSKTTDWTSSIKATIGNFYLQKVRFYWKIWFKYLASSNLNSARKY